MTLFFLAVSIIFIAICPRPIDKTFGAPGVPTSYFSATAKCVGLTITAFAFLTSSTDSDCLIAFLTVSNCNLFILAFTSGDPSVSLLDITFLSYLYPPVSCLFITFFYFIPFSLITTSLYISTTFFENLINSITDGGENAGDEGL